MGRPRDVPGTSQGRPWLKFHRIFQVGKKSFFLKNIFFFVFYGCLSFFNGKYRYFATFDQQILAEKLIFRILQHRFSRGSAISKMIVQILTLDKCIFKISPSFSMKISHYYHLLWENETVFFSRFKFALEKISIRKSCITIWL